MKKLLFAFNLLASVSTFAANDSDSICMLKLRCKEHKVQVATIGGLNPGVSLRTTAISVDAKYIKNGVKMRKNLGTFNALASATGSRQYIDKVSKQQLELAQTLCEERIEDLIFEYGECK